MVPFRASLPSPPNQGAEESKGTRRRPLVQLHHGEVRLTPFGFNAAFANAPCSPATPTEPGVQRTALRRPRPPAAARRASSGNRGLDSLRLQAAPNLPQQFVGINRL